MTRARFAILTRPPVQAAAFGVAGLDYEPDDQGYQDEEEQALEDVPGTQRGAAHDLSRPDRDRHDVDELKDDDDRHGQG